VIELSDMIRELRWQLNVAMAEGGGGPIRFELGPVQIEANVMVNREAGTGAKVKFWVVEADANGRVTQSRTQRITLTLQPKRLTPDGTRETALIAGDEVSGER
jgi:Trypsin-co-occurring domain 2